MPLLSKTQVVLTFEPYAGGAWFSQADPDSPRDSTLFDLCLPERTWEDMGSPQQITVTIEPGNTLEPDTGYRCGMCQRPFTEANHCPSGWHPVPDKEQANA